eukprot:PhM_4_TR13634/c0_g1_i1/m.13199
MGNKQSGTRARVTMGGGPLTYNGEESPQPRSGLAAIPLLSSAARRNRSASPCSSLGADTTSVPSTTRSNQQQAIHVAGGVLSTTGLSSDPRTGIRQLSHFFKVGSGWSGSVLYTGFGGEIDLDVAITDYDAASNTLLGYRLLQGQYETVTMKVFRVRDTPPDQPAQFYVTMRDGVHEYVANEIDISAGSISGTLKGANDLRGFYALQRVTEDDFGTGLRESTHPEQQENTYQYPPPPPPPTTNNNNSINNRSDDGDDYFHGGVNNDSFYSHGSNVAPNVGLDRGTGSMIMGSNNNNGSFGVRTSGGAVGTSGAAFRGGSMGMMERESPPPPQTDAYLMSVVSTQGDGNV